MGYNTYIVLSILGIVLIWGRYLVFIFWRQKKLNEGEKKVFLRKINQIVQSEKSPREKVIDIDIQMHQILKSLGYTWSFWEILKRNEKKISNVNELWKLHKTRNILVHEVESIREDEIEKILKKYEKYIVSFLK
jgi:hypothetical protein